MSSSRVPDDVEMALLSQRAGDPTGVLHIPSTASGAKAKSGEAARQDRAEARCVRFVESPSSSSVRMVSSSFVVKP